jgi:hypothetical protein
MFVDRKEHSFELWDGDPNKMTEAQINTMMAHIERWLTVRPNGADRP